VTPAGPFETAARFTSLILKPSRSSSNSTKLEASMYSINSLISLSKRPPSMRALRNSGDAHETPAPMDAFDRPHHNSRRRQSQQPGLRPLAATRERGTRRSGEGLFELQPRSPDFVADAPLQTLRADHDAQVVIPSDRSQDRQPGAARDGDLLGPSGRSRGAQGGGGPLGETDPFGGGEVDVERLPRRQFLDRGSVQTHHRRPERLGASIEDVLP